MALGSTAACKEVPPDTIKKLRVAPNHLRLTHAAFQNAKLQILQVMPRTLGSRFSRIGEITFDRRRLVEVVSQAPGIVSKLNVHQGEQVKKGAVLAIIKSRTLGHVKLRYIEASQRFNAARKTYEREKRLYEKKLATKDSLLRCERDLEAAKVALRLARQRIRLLGLGKRAAGASGKQGATKLTRYPLRAPLGGVVLEVKSTVGAAISEHQALFRLIDLTSVWGEVRVPIKQIHGVKVGQNVTVHCRRARAADTGQIVYVAPVADVTTRSVLVRISIPNPKGLWRPGIAFSAEFQAPGRRVALAIPRSAVHRIANRTVVFVLVGKSEFEARTVRLGQRSTDYVEVLDGLKKTEKVAGENSFNLKAEIMNREGS